MAYSIEQTARLRNTLYALDPDREACDKTTYETARLSYLEASEGCRTTCYIDATGNITVGIGFNMTRPTAKREWEAAFRTLKDPPSFHSVYAGEKALSQVEIHQLFTFSIQLRAAQLAWMYGPIWKGLYPNERLATESVYYNAPSLVRGLPPKASKDARVLMGDPERPTTSYHQHLTHYVENQDMSALQKAVTLLMHNAQDLKIPGLQKRRTSEAEMLASFKIPSLKVPDP